MTCTFNNLKNSAPNLSVPILKFLVLLIVVSTIYACEEDDPKDEISNWIGNYIGTGEFTDINGRVSNASCNVLVAEDRGNDTFIIDLNGAERFYVEGDITSASSVSITYQSGIGQTIFSATKTENSLKGSAIKSTFSTSGNLESRVSFEVNK